MFNQSDQKRRAKLKMFRAGYGELELQDLKIEEAASSAGIFPTRT